MQELYAELDREVPAASVLGYLNFSDGRPDPRWQKQVHDAFAFLASRAAPGPWNALHDWLAHGLAALQASGGSAFKDVTQARAALALYAEVLPAYRRHHADLLAHQSEEDLFQPFFLVRVLEAVLAERSSNGDAVPGVLARLNDYVGYRPIAILETRPRGEPYAHERHRPVPVYLTGVGVARGRYHDVLEKALELLHETDSDLLNAAHLDLDLLDEFAIDMRAYDQLHPVHRRPNNVFGEWDPHHIDNQGRYRRYVARQITLDGLLQRVEQTADRDPGELLFEAAAVLAGTMLMAAGISGWGPAAHESSATLTNLMPGNARHRDQFYVQLLRKVSGPHADRLRQDEELTRQAFGGPRQHLNSYLARHRAAQMQQRYLALLFAEMGYPAASRDEARRIPTASVRFLSEILSRISTGHHEAERGRLPEAAAVLPEVEDLLHRGIQCGALADPWNILGFQSLFPLSAAQEDSMRDPRLDELTQVLEQTFHLYARVSSDAAAKGDAELSRKLVEGMSGLAVWWDRFATTEVGDVRRVHGEEASTSAEHVATALGRWHERGEATADLAFWRQHLDTFRSPKSFALVIDALLRKQDLRAAMALLVNWVSQSAEVPLEEGVHSFHQLALRWLLAAAGAGDEAQRDPALVQKFFDYLEANAEDLWQIPVLEDEFRADEGEKDDIYGAAYEDVTWKDSADDNEEGSVAGGGGRRELDLEQLGPEMERSLRFQSTLARLWAIAARAVAGEAWGESTLQAELGGLTIAAWRETARGNLDRLLQLLDRLQAYPLPGPLGSYDSLLEFDRRRVFKEQLVYSAIGTCLDMTMAVGALTGASGGEEESARHLPEWGPHAIRLERALFRGDVETARAELAGFLERFRAEPLLFTTLADGGQPRQILRVRVAQAMLRVLLINLPRLGLLRETFELLRAARGMEQAHPPQGRGVTEFSQYFQAGFIETVEAVVESSASWESAGDDTRLVAMLERLTAPCLAVWVEHSRTVQMSSLEAVSEDEWNRLREFIQKYGGDLFNVRFMTLANLRGVLHRGVSSYLDFLKQEADPMRPVRLASEVDRVIPRDEAVRRLEVVLRAVTENYEEYKDYNATTSQSDYGENLHVLLDFLRLKVMYDRHSWEFRPLVQVHEVLARRGRRTAAVQWERSFTRLTGDLARQYLGRLAELERGRGIHLNTVGDRMHERFVKPLALDRLRALVEPAIREGQAGGPTPSFHRLQEELRAYTATPTGVGLDVPAWLRLLEAEVHRVLATRSTLAVLAEGFHRIGRTFLSLDDLKRQLDDWERNAPPL